MKSGMLEEGIAVLSEALETADKNGEHYYESELHRLNGQLLLRLDTENNDEAESSFLKAIDIARRQGAKSLELRAVTSLSRLLLKKRKRVEALKKLRAVYSWFKEGFDTRDLKEAQALLHELS